MKRGHGLWNQEKEIYGRPWRRLPPGSFSRLETVGQANAAMETLPLFTCGEASDFANDMQAGNGSSLEKKLEMCLFKCRDSSDGKEAH